MGCIKKLLFRIHIMALKRGHKPAALPVHDMQFLPG
jgi:hypothetical protein